MVTYLLTSDKWAGEVELVYNDAGLLVEMKNRSHMSDEQYRFFLQHSPSSLNALQTLTANTSAKAVLMPESELSFNLFWDRYNDKVNSSRKRAEAKWNRMSKADQLKAYNYIGVYKANIPHGTRIKFAETYLNAELWNN